MKQLISYREVLKYSRVNDKVPVCDIADICTWEENEFRRCLGMDFHKDLVNDLVDYSAVEEWENQAYLKGDTVSFEGLIYVAKVNTSNNPFSNDWELAPKFTDSDYEYFWCRYLGAYLGNVIMKASIPSMHSYITASGLQKRNTRDSEAVGEKEYFIRQRAFDTTIEVTYNNMLDYVANDTTEKFVNFGIKADKCGRCGEDKKNGCKCNKSRSRYYFGRTDLNDYEHQEFY